MLSQHRYLFQKHRISDTGIYYKGINNLDKLSMNSDTLTTSTTAVAADGALSTTMDGETVILHRDAGKYYGLNEVGTFVWELLQEPRSVDELCQEVVTAYDVDRDRCRSDIQELLVNLAEEDLARIEDI